MRHTEASIEQHISGAWGIWDTRDRLWVGTDWGPISFSDRTLAQAASQLLEDRVEGSNLGGRFRPRELPPGVFREWDTLKTQRTTLESLNRVEGDDAIFQERR